MRRGYFTAILLLALIGLSLWWRHDVTSTSTTTTPETTKQFVQQASSMQTQTPGSASQEPATNSNYAALIAKRMKQMEADTQRVQDEWHTPIKFYGKVVDENTNPVTDAQIDFGCNDTSESGTSNYKRVSDPAGLFSIQGISGKLLTVQVTKGGYYSSKRDNDSFYYAGMNVNFVPNENAPVMFHLRKMGAGEPLIHFHKSFRVPKDGSPIQIDLATGMLTTLGSNSVKVECWTHDTEKKEGWKYDWKCRISVPGGGLQIYDEQFPFEAPESGYVSEDNIDMTLKPGVGWSPDVQRSYYVQTASGKFGRIVFGMIAHGDHFCLIDSCLNPNGSRVLEPQQQ